MRKALPIISALFALLTASDVVMAQSVVVGPGGVRVYDDRGGPPPPPGYGRGDYGRGDYGPPRGYGPPPPPRSGGYVCATENGFCSFRGYATVRYGARGSYVSREARDGIPCNNRVFGDPAPGVPKRCVVD